MDIRSLSPSFLKILTLLNTLLVFLIAYAFFLVFFVYASEASYSVCFGSYVYCAAALRCCSTAAHWAWQPFWFSSFFMAIVLRCFFLGRGGSGLVGLNSDWPPHGSIFTPCLSWTRHHLAISISSHSLTLPSAAIALVKCLASSKILLSKVDLLSMPRVSFQFKQGLIKESLN